MALRRIALLLAAGLAQAKCNSTNSTNTTSPGGSGTITAPKGLETLTVGVIGDYGWFGFRPLPLRYCNEVQPKLLAAGVKIPNEILKDCDEGDRAAAYNASAFQGSFLRSRPGVSVSIVHFFDSHNPIAQTARYIAQVCAIKNCSTFISVGDGFYDSGVDLSSDGIIRFEESFVQMYGRGVFQNKPWYHTLGNHDVVKGYAGVDFVTKIAPLYDPRWNFGTKGLPYYDYDLVGSDWTAHVVVLDTDCFISKYQKKSSVYNSPYIDDCSKTTQTQVDFLKNSFAKSNATWKILQIHHRYISSSGNNTELAPLAELAAAHNAIVIMGHDHCLAHYVHNDTNHILTGAAGYPSAQDCSYGTPMGPFAKYLAANGFVTMDISSKAVNVEWYARDMQWEDSDLYPVRHDLAPAYKISVTKKST